MGQTQVTAEPGSLLVRVIREFDAPRSLVHRAYTDPDLLVQWLGPRRFTMVVEQWEMRHGGAWRYINRDADGAEYEFRGVFHGEPNLDRLVQTFEFEGYPGHVSLASATFEDLGGRTRVVTESVFQSLEDRDGAVGSGMAEGMSEGFVRLDELLDRMAAAV